MDLKVVCQKNEADEKNAPGPFIHCRGKTPGTNRLKKIRQTEVCCPNGEIGDRQCLPSHCYKFI